MKSSLLISLLGMMLLAACGNGGGNKPSMRTAPGVTTEQVQLAMDNQNFSCSSIDGSYCPGGIARLIMHGAAENGNTGFCSGFMVSEDTLITNNHCIPSQDVCDKTYIMIYNGYTYEKTRCSSLVKTLNDYPVSDNRKKLDVSVIKVKHRYYGSRFGAASKSASNGDKVTAWVVDHTGLDASEPNLTDVRITEFECKAQIPSSLSSSIVLEGCPVIHGNSGSPAVDSSGNIIGVIWGTTSGDLDTTTSLYFRRAMSYVKATATDISFFREYIR